MIFHTGTRRGEGEPDPGVEFYKLFSHFEYLPIKCYTKVVRERFNVSSFTGHSGLFSFDNSEKDLEIVCGEYESTVEIVSDSRDVEEVFQITEIVNHPNYKPNKVHYYIINRMNISLHG